LILFALAGPRAGTCAVLGLPGRKARPKKAFPVVDGLASRRLAGTSLP